MFSMLWVIQVRSQMYFPPVSSGEWEHIEPEELQWCTDEIQPLFSFLERQNTKAFILLKDGKIVLEKYFGSFQQDSIWYWASAGKTLTAFLVGMAQQEGHLSLDDRTSDYLGTGWSSCPPDKEALITIRHQLSMTTGLDDGVTNSACTIDTCLQYLADAGTRWAYHNAPYTLLDQVMEAAVGQSLNRFQSQKFRSSIGLNGAFLSTGSNNVFFSNARSMARFGLLILNNGHWNNNALMSDTTYFRLMTSTSQSINPSYGYLWWLNGKSQFMLPGLQFRFQGPLMPNAPADMISALGKNGQIINVVPSQNIVCVRMGNAPGEGAVTPLLSDSIWQALNKVICPNANANTLGIDRIQVHPNPAGHHIRLPHKNAIHIQIINQLGQITETAQLSSDLLDVQNLGAGMYLLRYKYEGQYFQARFLKN